MHHTWHVFRWLGLIHYIWVRVIHHHKFVSKFDDTWNDEERISSAIAFGKLSRLVSATWLYLPIVNCSCEFLITRRISWIKCLCIQELCYLKPWLALRWKCWDWRVQFQPTIRLGYTYTYKIHKIALLFTDSSLWRWFGEALWENSIFSPYILNSS